MTTKLPQVGEAAPRRRATSKKPAAQKKTAAPKKTATAKPADTKTLADITVRDQAVRAQQAREAAMARAAQPVPEEPIGVPAVELAPGMYETGTTYARETTAPATEGQPTVQAPLDASQLIVNQGLVDILKAVKGTSLADFEAFLNELSPMMDLWKQSPNEAAARRLALSILLLIKEKF